MFEIYPPLEHSVLALLSAYRKVIVISLQLVGIYFDLNHAAYQIVRNRVAVCTVREGGIFVYLQAFYQVAFHRPGIFPKHCVEPPPPSVPHGPSRSLCARCRTASENGTSPRDLLKPGLAASHGALQTRPLLPAYCRIPSRDRYLQHVQRSHCATPYRPVCPAVYISLHSGS